MSVKKSKITEEQLDEVEAYKLPDFSDEETVWMERALAVMKPKFASTVFLQKFFHYIEAAEFEQKTYLIEEIERQVWQRFWNNRYHAHCSSFDRIQANIAEYRELKEKFNKYLKDFGKLLMFTNPIERLIKLQEVALDIADIKILKVLKEFEKFEREYLTDNADPYGVGAIENRHKVALVDDPIENRHKAILED